MQLIPVHPSMWEKMGVHYLLIIDTEGLRAPERERFDVHEYDNELATLVIGLRWLLNEHYMKQWIKRYHIFSIRFRSTY